MYIGLIILSLALISVLYVGFEYVGGQVRRLMIVQYVKLNEDQRAECDKLYDKGFKPDKMI